MAEGHQKNHWKDQTNQGMSSHHQDQHNDCKAVFLGRRDFLRCRDFFNLRTAILLQGPLRWCELLEKVDWDNLSLELSVVEAEPQKSSFDSGLGE